jgi:hypothetical protein
MTLRAAFLVACVMVSAGTARAGRIIIARGQYNFSLIIADEFREVTAADGNELAGWQRGRASDPYKAEVQILPLGLPLSATPAIPPSDHSIIEAAARRAAAAGGIQVVDFRYRPFAWRTFQLEEATAHLIRDGESIVAITVALPLAPEAVQLRISGSTANEESLRAELAAIAASVDGKSNWVTEADRQRQWVERLGTVFAFALFGLVVWLSRRGRG